MLEVMGTPTEPLLRPDSRTEAYRLREWGLRPVSWARHWPNETKSKAAHGPHKEAPHDNHQDIGKPEPMEGLAWRP